MSMYALARLAPAGVRGIDANTVITYDAARALIDHGYRFVLRYVGRVDEHHGDLTAPELEDLLRAGLAVMPVQHVEAGRWVPTDGKGRRYGEHAAEACRALAMPPGVTVWLDLECVAAKTPSEQIIRYCNYWTDRVAAAGYQPGLYVGWSAGLSPAALYARLRVTRYWSAYNLNDDEFPAVCGVCMSQHEAQSGDVPAGVSFALDTNLVTGDRLGRFPMVCAPEEWAV